MARVMVIADSRPVAQALVNRLSKSAGVEACQLAPQFNGGYALLFTEHAIDTVVYAPQLRRKNEMIPNLAEAAMVFAECARAGIAQVVVVASAAIYGADPHNPGFIAESHAPLRRDKNPVGNDWAKLEALADAYVGQPTHATLTILRPVAVPVRGGTDYFSRLCGRGLVPTLPLYDPSMQLLSPDDLAQAVCCAIERSAGGVFNVAPDGVIPLRVALRMAGAKRLPVPRLVQRLARGVLTPFGLAFPGDQLEYIRYSWTVSNAKIKRELYFTPERSSAEALLDALNGQASTHWSNPTERPHFDDFGMDLNYTEAKRRRSFKFFHDYYWRIEVKGGEHIPRQGRAVLVGMHRGFMPFDGVMAFECVVREVGRYPRFLIHPCLIKTPFPFDFNKLGCLKVSRENADCVLQHDELLGFYPEGIQGAFRYYRGVYQLGKFGRDEYVKAALRNQAPIVPFVTVGSAEIFPVLAKFHWRWWKEQSLWPCFPIAPPFPLLPLPLPTKWHTQFLEPLHVEHHYPPEAANDLATVRAISQEVRTSMQDTIDALLTRRKSLFFGSIFKGETH
jgi:1-acyl-sn-glycerol-3-phosphate acyltransferase/nucleoside-diphosphate-sugar epimerase